MAIMINLDVMLARRKMSVTELSQRVGITIANLSVLKNGRARAIRFSTLDAICAALGCQPGDILEYHDDADHADADSLAHIPARARRAGCTTDEVPSGTEAGDDARRLAGSVEGSDGGAKSWVG